MAPLLDTYRCIWARELAMLRIVTATFAVLMLLVLPALAGDRAALNILGYSEDGRYFAYEESGVFDGSGGNYSHIFIVDLADGSLVNGTPFSMETSFDDNPNGPSLYEVRRKVADEAAPLIAKLKVGIPAEIMTLLGDGVPNADGKTMTVDRPSCCGPADTDSSLEMKLTIKTFASKMTGECSVPDALGFSLTLDYPGVTEILHTDGDTLPAARSCPQDYRLFAVVDSASYLTSSIPVVIVSSYPFDFEGTSRRFIAVPMGKWEEEPECG
jgi:predicted secreted protein